MADKTSAAAGDDVATHHIRAWRKKRRLTQEGLAEMAGLTPGAISQFETGISNPSAKTLAALAGAFGITPAQLLQGPTEGDEKPVDSRDAAIRKALLDYGVASSQIELAISVIGNFVVKPAGEKSEYTPPHDPSPEASPRRDVAPSRRKAPLPSS